MSKNPEEIRQLLRTFEHVHPSYDYEGYDYDNPEYKVLIADWSREQYRSLGSRPQPPRKLITHAEWSDTGWYEWAEQGDQADPPEVTVPGVGVVKVIEVDAGGEGHGEDIYMVFEITSEDDGIIRHYKMTGYYASYDGSNWDGGLIEVRPTPVQRTEWVRV